MSSLILSFNGATVKEYELDKETITIGRKPENDIHIDNLAVSSSHAKILTILNDSFIEDLQSTNGTLVNGDLVTKHALQNGDVITVGKHQLKYVGDEASESEFEKTMIIRPDAKGMPEHEEADKGIEETVGKIAADLASSDKGKSGPGEASLQLMSGANTGKELKLTKVLTTLGKPGTQVAAITRRPTGYFIIHVDGIRPIVNGTETGVQAHALKDNDVIEVAGVKMSIHITG